MTFVRPGLPPPARIAQMLPRSILPSSGTRAPRALCLLTCGYDRSWRSDSNRRPAVYKTAALPTELRQPAAECTAQLRRDGRTKA
jgi:hypothetical protein